MPFEQLQAELGLELGDRLRERRLGDVELLGRARDLSLFRDGHEVAKLVGPEAHLAGTLTVWPGRSLPLEG